ncbi:MAG: hypothetical protein WCI11_12520, partial [Candidatus Methylumidiphilus sp.]
MASVSHKDCIAQDIKTCTFVVTPNNKVDGAEPIYEISLFSAVNRHLATISSVAKDKGIDPDLQRFLYLLVTYLFIYAHV